MKTKIMRRQFTAEFKQQAVALLVVNGDNLAATARQVDVAPVVLGSWRDAMQSRAARLCVSTFMSPRDRRLAGRARQDRYPRALTCITRQIVSTRHWCRQLSTNANLTTAGSRRTG
jgi:transposase-like protein